MDETSVNTRIDQLITSMNMLLGQKDERVSFVTSPTSLITHLNKLKSMVEMVSIKDEIVSQINFLIVNHQKKKQEKGDSRSGLADDQMLHTVIKGDPGTGKTTVARILAGIWSSLGLIKKKKPGTKKKVVGNNIKFDSIKSKIEKLGSHIFDLRKNVISVKREINGEGRKEKVNEFLGGSLGKMIIANELMSKLLYEVDIEHNEEIATVEDEPIFVVAKRADLVGKYQGNTAIMTTKILESALGGVLFIDEAYSLINSERDSYGEECLNVINEYMSLHSGEIIVIFAGYKDKLEKTVFESQPGLARRFNYTFNIDRYTPMGLTKILRLELKKSNWLLDSTDQEICKLISGYKNLLEESGGFAEKLALQCKVIFGNAMAVKLMEDEKYIVSNAIDRATVAQALELMDRKNPEPVDDRPHGMYM